MTPFLIILTAITLAAGVRRARISASRRANIPEQRAQEINADPTTATGNVGTASAPKWSHTFNEFGSVTITSYDEWMDFMNSTAGSGADGMTESDGAALAELMMWGNSTFRAWERM